jgi:hypothetical protein
MRAFPLFTLAGSALTETEQPILLFQPQVTATWLLPGATLDSQSAPQAKGELLGEIFAMVIASANDSVDAAGGLSTRGALA